MRRALSGTALLTPRATEEHVVRHQENVYSYFNFIIPVEEKKHGSRLTHTKVLASLLVLTTLIVQSTVLYAIFQRIVKQDIKWQNKILNPSGETFGASPGGGSFTFMEEEKTNCNPGGSLCFKTNGTVSCAPPSVQLTGRWDELDTDGDGVWTREEAEASKEELRCKYAVNPVEVFDAFVTFLLDREKVIWLHPDVLDGKAIPKPYFTYASGDIIMCLYRSTEMCANVLRMGAFDAPLKYGTAPRVGETIESAMDYCYGLLKVGGTCERTLPSTYGVWRTNGAELCLEQDYDEFVYKHPVTGKSKSMLVVDYDARKYYSRAAGSELFIVYKSMIIGLFILALWNEFKACYDLLNLVIKFPRAGRFPPEEVVLAEKDSEGGDSVKYTVQGIGARHRATMAVIAVIRYIMLAILAWVGLSFLLKDTTYIDLLLNAVGFVFVMEIQEFVYLFIVDAGLKEEAESIECNTMPSLTPLVLAKNPALRNILALFTLVVLTVGIMVSHHASIVMPLWQALECTCLGEGDKCLEAQKFNSAFWEKYWRYEVPAVFDDVAVMKRDLQEGKKGFEKFPEPEVREEKDLDGGPPALAWAAPSPALAAGPGPAPMPRRRPHKRVVHHKHHHKRGHKKETMQMLNEADTLDHPYGGEPLWSAPAVESD